MQKTIANQSTYKTYLPKITISIAAQLFIISMAFIILFGSTGYDKIQHPQDFAAAMNKSKPLQPFARVLSYAIPLIELITVFMLGFPDLRKGKNKQMKITKIGLWSSFILMSLFTFYTAFILVRYAKNLPCSCGGILRGFTWKQHLIINIGFLLLAIRAIFLLRKERKLFAI